MLRAFSRALLALSQEGGHICSTVVSQRGWVECQRYASTLKIVLLQDHPHLGAKGEVVDVKPGYMRNLLYPRQIAVYATPSNIEKYKKVQTEVESAATESEIDTVLRLLSSRTVVTKRRASWKSGEAQTMIGQVTAADVAELCRSQLSVGIDPQMFLLDGPLKGFGEYKLPLNLMDKDGKQVEMSLRVVKTQSIN